MRAGLSNASPRQSHGLETANASVVPPPHLHRSDTASELPPGTDGDVQATGIHVMDGLEKTATGKIMRFALRDRLPAAGRLGGPSGRRQA